MLLSFVEFDHVLDKLRDCGDLADHETHVPGRVVGFCAQRYHDASGYGGLGMSAIQQFTNELIDYAGLFPPAKQEMPTVVANYGDYLKSEQHCKLARLIVPAARLAEFEKEAAGVLPTKSTSKPWRISALVPPNDEGGSDFGYAISGIRQFNERHRKPANGLAVVDVIEIKTPTVGHIERTLKDVPNPLKAFLEVPHSSDPTPSIEAIADFGSDRFFAKIRTGGVTPDLIPESRLVARFIHACADNLVGLKATAGLHHPLRDEFNLTYEADSPRATMHGFVNVFSAICFAFAFSLSELQIDKILNETSPANFSFDEQGLHWNGLTVSSRKLKRLRQNYAISFGSCSFTEPTAELIDLGIEKPEKLGSTH